MIQSLSDIVPANDVLNELLFPKLPLPVFIEAIGFGRKGFCMNDQFFGSLFQLRDKIDAADSQRVVHPGIQLSFTVKRQIRTAREITVSFYTPHPALSPSRGEEDAVNYFSNGPNP